MHILVGVDFSEFTAAVIDAARRQAQAFGAELCLLHVAEPEPAFVGYKAGPPTVREDLAGKFRKEHQALQRLAKKLRRGGLKVTALLERGPLAETLLKEAARRPADLIVLGSHGHGAMFHLLVGSVSKGVLKKARCPVLIVPARKPAG